MSGTLLINLASRVLGVEQQKGQNQLDANTALEEVKSDQIRVSLQFNKLALNVVGTEK